MNDTKEKVYFRFNITLTINYKNLVGRGHTKSTFELKNIIIILI